MKMTRVICLVGVVCLLTLGSTKCPNNSVDNIQKEETEQMVREAHQQVGMPDIVNFQERRMAKMLLELRDTEIGTYTYIVDMHGKLHFMGESIGYGLPYAVQFTNPEQVVRSMGGVFNTLPQPDPNGLFMPDSLSATWIMLVDPTTKEVRPVYVEPEIVVSPFPLDIE